MRSAPARLLDETAAFLLAAGCAGCDEQGTLLCDACRGALRATPEHRATPAGLPVVAALRFEGVAARCIRRVKEEGETLLARPLGAALAAAAALAPTADGFVPVPTSGAAFRRRGYRVPDLLMSRAGMPVAGRLRLRRRTADQRELGVEARRRNVAGSMRARHARAARDVLIVDDVVTTGSTLDEARRALEHAGFRVRGAVVLAATARADERSANPW